MMPYWRNEQHDLSIYLGDCRDVLPALGREFDFAVSSPPYAQGLEYEEGLDWDGLFVLMDGVARATIMSLRSSAFFMVNFGETTKYDRTMAELYNRVFRDAGWIMHSRRIWAKSFAQCRLTGAMQTHTISAAEWENIWTFRKPPNSNEIHRDKRITLRGIWTTSEQNGVKRAEHPAVYPVDLPMKGIRAWSDIGDSVLDPFLGSGTTLVACYRLGRGGTGIEKVERYCQLAAERLEGEIAQGRLFDPSDTETKSEQLALEAST